MEPGEIDRRKIVILNVKSARMRFIAALGLYLLWIGALVALAVVSGERPPESKSRTVPAPATTPADPEPPSE